MGKKSGDNKGIYAIIAIAVIVGAYIYFNPETLGGASTGARGTTVGCAKQTGTTPDGTAIIEEVPCGSGQTESIFGGTEGVTFYYISVGATANADTNFDNFKLTAVDVKSGASIAGAVTDSFKSGAANVIQSGPISGGSTYTWSTKQSAVSSAGACVQGAAVTVPCDTTTATAMQDEDWVYKTSTGTCECWLKAANIESVADPTTFEATIEATRTPVGGGTPVVSTATQSSAGYTIAPDPSGAFSVSVTAST